MTCVFRNLLPWAWISFCSLFRRQTTMMESIVWHKTFADSFEGSYEGYDKTRLKNLFELKQHENKFYWQTKFSEQISLCGDTKWGVKHRKIVSNSNQRKLFCPKEIEKCSNEIYWWTKKKSTWHFTSIVVIIREEESRGIELQRKFCKL